MLTLRTCWTRSVPYERAVACLRRRQRYAVRVVFIYTFVSYSVFQRVKRFESCLAAQKKKVQRRKFEL